MSLGENTPRLRDDNKDHSIEEVNMETINDKKIKGNLFTESMLM